MVTRQEFLRQGSYGFLALVMMFLFQLIRWLWSKVTLWNPSQSFPELPASLKILDLHFLGVWWTRSVQPFSEVQFDNPSHCLECPEAFTLSNILHHIKKKHHLGNYADIFGYCKERELRRDIDKLLRHIHSCKKTASISSQWEQLCIFLDDAIHFLIEIETGLLQNNATRITNEMSAKIEELEKMKAEIDLFIVYTLTPPSLY